MAYHESQGTALLHSKDDSFEFGDSLLLDTSGGSLPLPIDSPRFPLKKSSDLLTLRPRCFWAIFEQPHGTGINPYLLLSTSYLPAQQSVHAAALAKQETHPGWRAQWFGTSKCYLRWARRDPSYPYTFRDLHATLSAPLLNAIWEIYGHPHDEAEWLATSLLPRRRGATFLMPTPSLLQLWIRLF